MRVRVGDIQLFFDVEGPKLVPDGPSLREKPTLLLLHGGPGFDHSLLKPWFTPLRDVAQLVYLDHRGNGQSDRPPLETLTLQRWADDIPAFCDAVGIRRPIVLGVSFGGFVAQAYAARHADHPLALILCNTAARAREDRALAVFERLGGGEAREAAAAFFRDPSPATLGEYARLCTPLYNRTPQDPHLMTRGMLHANFDLCLAFFRGEWRKFDFRDELRNVRCPTLVVGGAEDPITPLPDSEDLAAALPASLVRLERFAGCGHPVYQDQPERFVQVVRDFVALVGAGT
jgi:pimeloyl-ACP methyl ester carboxylesterase